MDSDDLVNWSIRLTLAESDTFDDLAYDLRRKIGKRLLNKADIFRALLHMADNDPAVRDKLIHELGQHG